MPKQKSFFSKIVERMRDDEGFRWKGDYLRWLREMRDSVQLDIRCPYRELAGQSVMSLQQESFVRALDERRIAHEGADEAYVYPGLSVAWEDMPATVTLRSSFVRSICDEGEQGDQLLDTVELSSLERLMPACLLIDARKLGFCLHGVDLEGLFVYPSYDVERGYAILLLVGVSLDNGLRFPLQSKLVLKGKTFADAMRASKEECAFLASMWWGEGGEEGLVEVFSPLDDDQELMELSARLLAYMCASEARLTRHSTPKWESIDVTITATDEGAGHSKAKSLEQHDEITESGNGLGEGCETGSGGYEERATSAGTPSEPAPASLEPASQDDRVRELEKLVSTLQARVSSLNYSLELAHITASELKEDNERLRKAAHLLDELELPATPLEALLLAQEAFPKQLVFLASAQKSAEEFKGGSAQETWSVLQAMATVLQPLLSEGSGADIGAQFQALTGFELALRDTKATKSDAKLQRLRRFEYKGASRDASAHVKGRSVKSGKCLRVHFFYEQNDQQLVIAHCGEHLKTAGTSRR